MNRMIRIGVAATLALSASVAMAQAGADTYKSKCAMCHGADGLAQTGAGKAMKVPSVKDFKPGDDLIAITTDGKGKMPSYKGKLTDPQIKEVVSYLKSLGK
ncbi:cytochrome c6 [Bryocella elongata]|uniref:Cytochrome c6 n=1 Tax=Bryocella elongata TaxID=863522 RepID=A0A1H5VXH7_9BACT|nr:cytochrome c [Bryocella elongata]SEF91920.1 cytochrome c6 [Bryocella elongata]